MSDYQMCRGKRSFSTWQQAKDVGQAYGHRPYRCPKCGKWHLSSDAKSARKRDKR